MITVATQGGLGNQMFQYAMGLAQANRLQTSLRIDRAANGLDSRHPFNLDLFQIPEPTVQSVGGETLVERSLAYDRDIDLKVRDGHTLLGYWQNEKYFQSIASTIRLRFRSADVWPPDVWQFADLILSTGRVSTLLSIRRGDYTKSPHTEFHGLLGMEYFHQALETVRVKLDDDEPVVFVFSDDVDWVQDNLKLPFTTIYYRGDLTTPGHIGREDIPLTLMSLCNNAVISNSSFSWWGAWLGDRRRTGTVVAPARWFLNTEAQSQIQIVPDRWTKL